MTEIKLREGVKIYFDKENTWRNRLGFGNVVSSDKINISDKITNVMTCQRIYLTCDIISGAYFDGVQSKILYSLSNYVDYGEAIILNPKTPRLCNLLDKSFQSIKFRFHDRNGKSVNFSGALCTLCIEIKQV